MKYLICYLSNRCHDAECLHEVSERHPTNSKEKHVLTPVSSLFSLMSSQWIFLTKYIFRFFSYSLFCCSECKNIYSEVACEF